MGASLRNVPVRDNRKIGSIDVATKSLYTPVVHRILLGKAVVMKVTVNVDCTPEEARAFMGLPDVQPMQQAVMAELEQQMKKNINAMSPEAMVQTWMPAGMQGAESLQKMFWNQMQSVMSGVVNTAGGMLTMNNKDPESKVS